MKRSTTLAILALAGLFAAGCAPKVDDSVIRIGEYDALTGDIATFGQTTHNGIQMAVDEVNAAGGINGKLVKLITEDDQGKPEEASLVVEKLITRDQVHVVIGEVASSNSLAAAPMAQSHKIPMVSPSSTNPKVTAVGDYIFRVCFIDLLKPRPPLSSATRRAITASASPTSFPKNSPLPAASLRTTRLTWRATWTSKPS
jgi:branched-chain amino acid transport system substrate-binding protein